MPPRRLHTRPSGATETATARRRAPRTKPPPHEPAVLPIHANITGDLRAFHTKYPPAGLSDLLKDTIGELREASKDLAEKRRTFIIEPDEPRDEDDEKRVADLGKRVEKNVRGLVDLDYELEWMKDNLVEISRAEREKGDGDGIQPVEEFVKRTQADKRAHRKRDMKDRYGNVAEYIDFRAVIHAVSSPTAPQPQKKDWFKKPLFICDAVAEISDEEMLSESGGEGGEAASPELEMMEPDSDDDELQETSATVNLKCPLTMQRFVDPVKSSSCKHTFEKDAILGMLKSYKKQKKNAVCPTTGCGREIKASDLREDLVMKSLVAAQIRKEEREAERMMMGMDDEGRSSRRSKSQSKSKSRASLKGKEKSRGYDEIKEEEEEDPVPSRSKGKSVSRPSRHQSDEDEDDEEGEEEGEEDEDDDEESPQESYPKSGSRSSRAAERELPYEEEEIPYGSDNDNNDDEEEGEEEEEMEED